MFEYFQNEAFEYVIQPFRKAIQRSSIETPAEQLTHALRHFFASHSCKQPHPESTSSSLHAPQNHTFCAPGAAHPVTTNCLPAKIPIQKSIHLSIHKAIQHYVYACGNRMSASL
ncbi:hypothetical protein FK492_20665 [Pantoea dispersa]|uniref:Uncharacterized protein n=1 Tax=Pantoea dispersa TaxID=59814 RepID=A0ABY2ZSM9_9GAMM|nr:hypothetical protein FK492_20665 [Pantoea dispersa]